MSASDDKKAKRRKNKRGSVVKSIKTQSTCQSISNPVDLSTPPSGELLTSSFDTEVKTRILSIQIMNIYCTSDGYCRTIFRFTAGAVVSVYGSIGPKIHKHRS